MNYFSFENKVALIIGGGSGLGYEVAKGLGQSGANIILASRDSEKLERARAKLVDEGLSERQIVIVVSDITIERSRRKLLENVNLAFGGRLDILVNSAGINIRSDLADTKLLDTHKSTGLKSYRSNICH